MDGIPRSVELSDAQMQLQALLGQHRPLVCVSAPANAQAALGELDGKVLSINGTYRCLVPISGLKSTLQVHIQATLGGGATLTSSGPDLLGFDADADTVANAANHIRDAGTGDGSVTSGTAQTASVTPNGQKWALYDLVVAAAGTVTITRAETNGK